VQTLADIGALISQFIGMLADQVLADQVLADQVFAEM
jgi:hypothetical protein